MLSSKSRLPTKTKWQKATSRPSLSNNEVDSAPPLAATPSPTPLRRCRSASAIRQKIMDASDFSQAKSDLPGPETPVHRYRKPGLTSHKPLRKPARSSATVLEMELVERLSELEVAHVPRKNHARLQVAQDILDEVILQDRTFAGVLLKIRAEFNRQFAERAVTPEAPGEELDLYLLKTENQALKKLCNELQHEVETLRHELLFQPFAGPAVDGHEDDDVALVQLESPPPVHSTPPVVPKLNLASIAPFQDEDFAD
ncbi:hypothetical protein ACHHYP_00934 [Achlya hypogyna]|uniref:Uncharacterized protein n=1 Tax=Achlya hypogyna TaxID=1202772 RepID=A0A1V9ZA11_ACHHY|nr:hypothetical protein ACHHYP_00934 [Achlya hypogyna]